MKAKTAFFFSLITFLASISFAAPGDLIFGGKEVRGIDPIAKHIVALNDGVNVFCTGTLIDRNIVLTAAHCVPQDIPIFIGFVRAEQQLTKINNLRAIKAVVHPKYIERNAVEGVEIGYPNDLALLRFEGKIPTGYAPIGLVSANALKAGQEVYVSGYGVNGHTAESAGSGILRITSVKVIKPLYMGVQILLDQTQGQGACHGDSGGPSFVLMKNTPIQVGVASHYIGDNCASKLAYTSIPVYLKWIQGQVARLKQ